MRRREFITLIGGAAAWPLAARAQRAATPIIGFLGSESLDAFASRLRAFRQGLGDAGYVEGSNVVIEYRWAEGHIERLMELATDLVGRRVAVIVTLGSMPASKAAKAATSTIPVVFQVAADPVASGLVASLNRPGGNLTGVTSLNVEVGPKRLELLHELVPSATIAALLVNPANPNFEALTTDTQAAARALGLELHILNGTRFRFGVHSLGATAGPRARYQPRSILLESERTARRTASPPRNTHDLPGPRVRQAAPH